jgi:hypothetical protein
MLKRALHYSGELDLESLDGPDRRDTVVAAQAVNVEFTLGDVCNVVILKVEDALGVFDNGAGIRGYEKLDRLREAIFGEESTRLAPDQLGTGRGRRGKQSARLTRATSD